MIQLLVWPILLAESRCAGWEIRAVESKIQNCAPFATLNLTGSGFYFSRPLGTILQSFSKIQQSEGELLMIQNKFPAFWGEGLSGLVLKVE